MYAAGRGRRVLVPPSSGKAFGSHRAVGGQCLPRREKPGMRFGETLPRASEKVNRRTTRKRCQKEPEALAPSVTSLNKPCPTARVWGGESRASGAFTPARHEAAGTAWRRPSATATLGPEVPGNQPHEPLFLGASPSAKPWESRVTRGKLTSSCHRWLPSRSGPWESQSHLQPADAGEAPGESGPT